MFGTFSINSVTGNRVMGSINFRGSEIPIHGTWDEGAKQLKMDSPYASYSGHLSILDDASIKVRHYILNGTLLMKPPSIQAGEHGTWIATTNTRLTGTPIPSQELPPVGAFLTTVLLNGGLEP
ncbi:hypothetical protein [Paenibacillus cremeus]|uniref:hypothetical protein n=1 Tax=Paenibacillus cremeus TaxID=2163881 RepID=UPI0021BD8EF4|nr:hypothetical protein [Paenibacillus cremeus]